MCTAVLTEQYGVYSRSICEAVRVAVSKSAETMSGTKPMHLRNLLCFTEQDREIPTFAIKCFHLPVLRLFYMADFIWWCTRSGLGSW